MWWWFLLSFPAYLWKRGISSFPKHLGQVFPVYTQQWDFHWDARKQLAVVEGVSEQLGVHLAPGWPQHVTQLLQHLTSSNFVEKLTDDYGDDL